MFLAISFGSLFGLMLNIVGALLMLHTTAETITCSAFTTHNVITSSKDIENIYFKYLFIFFQFSILNFVELAQKISALIF